MSDSDIPDSLPKYCALDIDLALANRFVASPLLIVLELVDVDVFDEYLEEDLE